MPRVEFDAETPLSPEQVVAALTDFSDRRPDIWQSLSREVFHVYSVGDTMAEVREGNRSPKIWARERYDWSTPGTVRWEVLESNFCDPGSYVEARITPGEHGGSRVHVVWDRTTSSIKWKLMLGLIALTRGAPVKSSLVKGLRRYAGLSAS
jgi:hypothetical protein